MLGKMPKMCSSKSKMKMVNESGFDEFLSRISKTLYYGDEIMVEDHLSYPVIELAAEIYSDLKTGKSIDRLYLDEATEMTQKVKVNPCYLVLALLYIERLKDCNTEYLDNIAPSQLFLISLVLASKFHDDSEFELSLSMFDKFSDLSRSDIFQLELAFLSALQWKVTVSEGEFYKKLVQMEKLLAMKSASKRNWFTYTEMSTLLLDEAWTSQLTSLLVTVSAVCFTTYTAGVLTLLASSVLASHIASSAALVILSTTAQLSLLVPSSGTPPSSLCNGTHSMTSLPTDTIEEALERKILDGLLLDDSALEDLISRRKECASIRDGGFDHGWRLNTKNGIRTTAGNFGNVKHGGSNGNSMRSFDNWNIGSMAESRRNSFGFLGGNMQATGCIRRNPAWNNRDVRFRYDGKAAVEKDVGNVEHASNADHTSIRTTMKSLDNSDGKRYDISKADLTLHSHNGCDKLHPKKDLHVISTVLGLNGVDSKTDSHVTYLGLNSRLDSGKSSHCLEHSGPMVSHCCYNQSGLSVYGPFCADNLHHHSSVYEYYEECVPCKLTLGRDIFETFADSIQYDVSKRGYAELTHNFADSTKYDAELGYDHADSTEIGTELEQGYADSTQSHAESTLSSIIPFAFPRSIPMLSSLAQFSLSDYLPPLRNISTFLLGQINDDLFSAHFNFDLTSSDSTDIVEDRYRFVGIDSYYRTGVYRRENEVEILSC